VARATLRFMWTILCIVVVTMQAAQAKVEKRVALVIGNSSYRHVAKLANPANDATTIAEVLKAARFDVVDVRHDLGLTDLRRALEAFSAVARQADIALVYFAGHGIEIDGNNFLIPIDARLATSSDVERETIALDRVLRSIEPAKQLHLVILDACRDNPFVKTMKQTGATRSIGRGLSAFEPTMGDTLVAFAARGGSVALDGDTDNSPFAIAVARHIVVPGLDIRYAFGRVRDDVMAVTQRQQEPFVYGSLGGDTVALVDGPVEKLSDQVAALRSDLAVAQAERDRLLVRFRSNAGTAREALEELANQNIAALRRQLASVEEALAAAKAREKESAMPIEELGQRLDVALVARAASLTPHRTAFFRSLRTALGDQPDIRTVGDRFVFQADALFDQGSAALRPSARPVLDKLAAGLIDLENKIPAEIAWVLRVDGHADARPGAVGQFRSKWELASTRAAAIVQYLIEKRVQPQRLVAAGFGEFQPLDSDASEEAFRRNRRIELKLTER
jgi:flagellar motor protein MotB